MDCPLCKVNLQLTDRQGVEIDYCPKCRGIWLDRGELEKLIALSVAQAPFSSPPFMDRNQDAYRAERHPDGDEDRFEDRHGDRYGDRYGHAGQYYDKPKKRESWLRNLLDFD